MSAGTSDKVGRTRARLFLASEFLKKTTDAEQRLVALRRIDQLLDELNEHRETEGVAP